MNSPDEYIPRHAAPRRHPHLDRIRRIVSHPVVRAEIAFVLVFTALAATALLTPLGDVFARNASAGSDPVTTTITVGLTLLVLAAFIGTITAVLGHLTPPAGPRRGRNR